MNSISLEKLLVNEMVIIYRYLIKIGASVEDAEDLVQDTLYKAVQYSNELYQDKIFSWLFKVTINNYYNLCKRKKILQVITLDENAVTALSSSELLDKVSNAELQAGIQAVFRAMKDSYRNLLVLKYIMNLSYKEIGQLLGFDENKVKTYLARARNKFKKLWEEAGYDRR